MMRVPSGISNSSLRPVTAVKVSIADGFGDVHGLHFFAAGKVGNGTRNLEYAVVGTCRKVEPCHCCLEHCEACLVENCILCNELGCHLCIAVDALFVFKAFLLYLAGCNNAFANCSAWFAWACIGYFNVR